MHITKSLVWVIAVFGLLFLNIGFCSHYDLARKFCPALILNFEDETIYGQWPEDQLLDKEHARKFNPTPMSELTNQMYNTKYSFMIAIQKGWPSSKYWKHLFAIK